MSLKICSFSSGSKGNCTYISSGGTRLLIDMGISCARAEKHLQVLNETTQDINVLVTHTHGDHINGLPVFMKKNGAYGAKVYAHYCSVPTLRRKGVGATGGLIQEFGDESLEIGDLLVSPFRVGHDVPCVGFNIFHEGRKITYMTDLGSVTPSILGKAAASDIVMIESNHDETLLNENRRYTYALKKRILSEKGHLSNSACAEAVVTLARSGAKQIMLAHLSEENNAPELALSCVQARLKSENIGDVSVVVALQYSMTGLYEIS